MWLPGSNGTRDHLLEDARTVAKRGIAGFLPQPAGPVLTCDSRERPTFAKNVVLLRRSIDVLSSLPTIDRSRLGAVGFSYGAMVTATAAGVEPRLRAVVLDSGRAHHSTAARQYCGATASMVKSLQAIDPVRWVGKSKAPILVQNGSRDSGTPRAEALALAKAARTTVKWYPALHALNERAFADRAAFLVARLQPTRAPASATAPWHGCVGAGSAHGFLRASDGGRVAFAATGRGATAVVLAHQGNGDLCTWWPFAEKVAAAGLRALAFDFRGYGLSPDRAYPATLRKDLDLRAAIAKGRSLGSRRFLLAGASLGGTVALAEAARAGSGVAGVVSVSAGETYVRFDGKALARRSPVPVLFVAARRDAQFAADARTLYGASAARDKRLVLVEGGEHGAPLLERPALRRLVLDWLRGH